MYTSKSVLNYRLAFRYTFIQSFILYTVKHFIYFTSTVNLESPVHHSPSINDLDHARKLEYIQEIHAGTERACKRHIKRPANNIHFIKR